MKDSIDGTRQEGNLEPVPLLSFIHLLAVDCGSILRRTSSEEGKGIVRITEQQFLDQLSSIKVFPLPITRIVICLERKCPFH